MLKKISVFSLAIILIFLFGGCGLNMQRTEKSSNIVKNLNTAADTSALNAINQVGNVGVAYGEGGTANVKATIKLTGGKNIDFDNILKNVDINLYEKDKTIYALAVYRPSNNNIWEWIKGKGIDADLSVNLTITVPKSISGFSVCSNVGNIGLANPNGVVNIQDNVGNISIQNPTLTGACNLKTNVGNINCSFGTKQNSSGKINAISNAGNIIVKVNNGIHAAKQHTDNKVVGSSSQIIVDDNFVINAKTDVGNISVEN